MICSSVNRDRFIRPSLRWAGLYLRLEEFQGVTSSAVLGNTGTTIAFRVGAEDASLLASHIGSWIADSDLLPRTLKELPNFECIARVLQGGAPQAVRLKTEPPPPPVHDRV